MSSNRTCRVCSSALWHRNKTGLCRRCAALDPELQAKRAGNDAVKMKRAEATRRALAAKPEIRERQRRKAAEFNRTPEMRAKSREISARPEAKTWRDKGRAACTPQSFALRARSMAKTALAKIPPDQRQLYRFLRTVKRLPAAEALEIVTQHEAAKLEKFRREIGGSDAE